MKANSFLQEVPPEIIERAKQILRKDGIITLQIKDNFIEASVKGNYLPFYQIKIKTDGEEIEGWYCDCPYDGEVCKHVVAVILKTFLGEETSKNIRKRKTKTELAEEILEKLSFEELKEFVREGIKYSREWRNALLARFAHYADLNTRTPEAKYNAIFRKLVSSYKKRSFIDYYATIELEREVDKLLFSAKNLIERGKLEEAYAIAKSVLSGWVKNLQNMDDSAGSTELVIDGVFEIFKSLYLQGKKDILDYLLKEGSKKDYHDFGIDYKIAYLLVEIIESQEEAQKLLTFVNKFEYGRDIKAKVLLKFFHEKYKEFVKSHITDFSVANFHIKELLNRKAYKEALVYVEEILSHLKGRNKAHFLEKKAIILEKLGKNSEALKIYHSFFTLDPSLNYLWKMKELASPEEWKEIKKEARKLLREVNLLKFFLKEREFSEWLKALEQEKKNIGKSSISFRDVVTMLKELPEEIAREAAWKLLEVSHLMLETYNPNRKLYREFITSIDPLKYYLGENTIKVFLEKVIALYPARKALKDEIQKYLRPQ